jgi:UTP--glucose-1-phosphate uridylyltransferase
MKKIRKAIIPAAGFGTRFLPATIAQPKEMLPVVDKPIIQYVVEEAVGAGIEDIIIVTGWQKKAIEDHFDYPFELEKRLENDGKEEQLREVRRIANLANFIYIRQKGHPGNATPILNASHLIGPDEPFLVLWGDDFIDANPSQTTQLINAYEKYGYNILGAIKTQNPEDTRRYAFGAGDEVEPGVIKLDNLIEKPGPDKAPSDLAIVSGFILTPKIFPCLKNLKPSINGEVVYMDGISELIKKEPVYACEIKNGHYYDCGNKLEYIKANIDFALKRKDLAQGLKDHIKKLDL